MCTNDAFENEKDATIITILFLSLQDEFYEIFIPDFIKSKEKGKNKDEIRRQNQLEVGEGNKAEDVAETEEHYVNALQMGGLL